MRTASLLLLGSILAGGCTLFGDCESFTPDYSQQQPGLRIDTDAVPVTDTLTVAVLNGLYFELAVGRTVETPETHASAGLSIDFTSSGTALPEALRSVVRNDTVFVGTPDAFNLYREVCSPSYIGAELHIDRVRAPDGVRVIRWTQVFPGEVPDLPDDGLRDV